MILILLFNLTLIPVPGGYLFIMQNLIINYLEDYFKLPARFIRPEADLNILSVLSLYFDKDNKRHQSISLDEIDPGKLSLDIDDLEIQREEDKLEIGLNKVLKTSKYKRVVFPDIIGRDSFCEFHLHFFLAILELPEKVSRRPKDQSKLDTAKNVGDIFKGFDITYNFSKN